MFKYQYVKPPVYCQNNIKMKKIREGSKRRLGKEKYKIESQASEEKINLQKGIYLLSRFQQFCNKFETINLYEE
jgi:hypothetical protein